MLKTKRWVTNRVTLTLVLFLVGWAGFVYGNLGVTSASTHNEFRILVYQEGLGDSTLTVVPYIKSGVISDGSATVALAASVVNYIDVDDIPSGTNCLDHANDMKAKWLAKLSSDSNFFNNLLGTSDKVAQFQLGDSGLDPKLSGQQICVVAMRLVGQTLAYKTYVVEKYELPDIPELNSELNSKNSDKRAGKIVVGSLAHEVNKVPLYDAFTSRSQVNWVGTPSGNIPTPTPADPLWGGIQTEDQTDSQTGQIMLSTDACRYDWLKGVANWPGGGLPYIFDPTNPDAATKVFPPSDPDYSTKRSFNYRSVCAPQTYLHLDAEPNEPLKLYVKDLCINGWDRTSSQGHTTFRIWRVKKNVENPLATRIPAKDIHGKAINITYNHANSSLNNGGECYDSYTKNQESIELKIEGGEIVAVPKDGYREMAITLLDADHNTLEPVAARRNIYVAKDGNYVESKIINTHAVHLYEFFELKTSDLGEDESFIIDAHVGDGFNLFSLGIADRDEGASSNHGRITYDNNLMLDLEYSNGQPWPSVLSVSNNTYYSNDHGTNSPQYHRVAEDNPWEYSVIIAAPCDHPDFDFFSGVQTTTQPVGLFDSDIYAGGFPSGAHKVEVREKGRTGEWSRNGDFDGKPVIKSLVFDGLQGVIPVHHNGFEYLEVNFDINKIYEIKFTGIHHRNFVQFVLPFGQYSVSEKCDAALVDVEFDQQCNLNLKNLDWKHPATRGAYDLINLDLLHRKRHGETERIVEHPGTGNEYRIVAGNLARENPSSNDTLLIPFKPDPVNSNTWFSLIEDPDSGIKFGESEQIQLTGYYDGSRLLQSTFDHYPSATHDPTMMKVAAVGHGEFRPMKGPDNGQYYFEVNPDTPEELRIPSSGYCVWTEFEVEIDKKCDIYITNLIWSRPNLPDPKLRINVFTANPPPIRSITSIAQVEQVTSGRKLLIPWRDKYDDNNDKTLEKLLGPQDPNTGNNQIALGLNNRLYVQITGYYRYDSNGNLLSVENLDNSGHDKDYELGLIANSGGSPGPPAMLFHIYDVFPGDPDEDGLKIKYGNHSRESPNWVKYPPPPAPQDLHTRPNNDPYEFCNKPDTPLVEFVKDPTSIDLCDLELVHSAWKNLVNHDPKYIQLEISYGDSNWASNLLEDTARTPVWTSSFPINQHATTTAGPQTILEWVSDDPTKVTFKSLIDASILQPDPSHDWQVKLVGYYDPDPIPPAPPNPADFVNYNDASFSVDRDRILVDGHVEFRLLNSGTPANPKYSFSVDRDRIPAGLGEFCPEIQAPEPEIEIEINDQCEIIVTKLDWGGLEDDHDNNSATPHSALTSANNFRISIYKRNHSTELDPDQVRKRLSSATPHTYFEYTSVTPPTLQSLEASNALTKNVTYEVRLNGFDAGIGPQEMDFDAGKTYLAKLASGAEGWFQIKPFTDHFSNNHRIILGGSSRPTDPTKGCLPSGMIPPPFVNIDINNVCDIIITNIGWLSNDSYTHNLELSFSPNPGILRGQSSTSKTIHTYKKANPPYAGQLNQGTYNVWLTGYFDDGDGGARKDFSARDPTLATSYQAGGVHTFQIHHDSGLGYYITVNGNRIPTPIPPTPSDPTGNPTPYCYEPCPPGSPNTTPPCYTTQPGCDIADQFEWTNHPNSPHRANDVAHGVLNSIWYETNPNTTINIANERYNPSYASGTIHTSTSAVGGTGPFNSSFGKPSSFYVIPLLNRPGSLIPGTNTGTITPITRQKIIDDLIDSGISGGNGFEYNFSNDPSDANRKLQDSVWSLSGDPYRPVNSIKWNKGPPIYNDTGYGSGWRNTYDLTITPEKLTYKNDGSVLTSTFNPSSTNTQNNFVDFTINNPQTRGNNQTEYLLTYDWEFYWRIDVTHRHTVNYDRYDLDVSRKTFDWWVRTKTWVPGYYVDNNIPPTPGDITDDTWVPGHYTYGAWYWLYESSVSGGRNPSPPANWASANYEYQVRNVQNDQWSYFGTSLTEEEERKTTITGVICSTSYVLIVRPPECIVQRRYLFGTSTEKRRNPSRVDPHNPDNRYEIFPPGKDDHFSRLELTNYNHFELEPTSPQTEATLRPTLNTANPWYPRNNSGTRIGALPSVGPTDHDPMSARPWGSAIGVTTDYQEQMITPKWPGEYRLNWDVGWESNANLTYPDPILHYSDIYRGTANHKWQGDEPPTQSLVCSDPADGIYVYVSAKPPKCSVEHSIFEFTDPSTRIKIGLRNDNWVDLVVPGKTVTTQNFSPWPNSITSTTINLSPYGPASYSLPQGYTAERPPGSTIPSGIPDPIAGDAEIPTPHLTLTRASYPALVGTQWFDIISDSRMADMPAPLGKYTFVWDLRARLGIEWWSSDDIGKVPGAWWDGTNIDERISQNRPSASLNTYECKDLLQIVRIPFVKAFIGGMSAGGRFGLGNEYNSCKYDNWILNPTGFAQGAWGHSADSETLSSAIGSSVEHALRAQKSVGGIYSSSLTEQPDSHTDDSNVQSKALTYANNDLITGFGGDFSNPTDPKDISWRCLPNYWRIPDNANEGVSGLRLNNIAAPQEGAATPNTNSAGQNVLGPGDLVDIKDGAVLYIKGDLEITGEIREAGEEDLRASIFVEGNVIISGNITNNINSGKKYFGFSDMGLIQIIALGDIGVQPQVTKIDATLVAYPVHDPVTKIYMGGGAIDLCASQTEDAVQHYNLCASDETTLTNRQLIINGALVAQRIYLNRLNETLKNRSNLESSVSGTPLNHDGSTPISFDLYFSENPDLSFLTLRNAAFTVTGGGSVTSASRLVPGSNLGWRITVTPSSSNDLVVTLPHTINCTASGAICTSGGTQLSNTITITIPGPGSSQTASTQSTARVPALGREPIFATYTNTKASEVIVLMPEYHFVTPAASVFDDWVKRPQAIFDIPTSL